MPQTAFRHSGTDRDSPQYCGRFAPSPSGPLHFGSLLTAVASYLEAKTNHGLWLVRIEDLDTERTVPGADSTILSTLASYGFQWDGEISYQSQRSQYYQEALITLDRANRLYGCRCTRKQIQTRCEDGHRSAIYDGYCRTKKYPWNQKDTAIRIVAKGHIAVNDAIQGRYQEDLTAEVGDFHLLRRDGCYAYHLAVVVDDYLQNISHIVRGADLLGSTPSQIYLQTQLGYPSPVYAHVPIAINRNGQKLSKQNLAMPIATEKAPLVLWQALKLLGQHPPQDLQHGSLDELWCWATTHWQLNRVPQTHQIRTECS